jgi:hypothetical protein
VYPPVNQAVFAIATWSTPSGATIGTRIVWLKGWLLLFDLATILVIAATLKLAKLHPAWLIAYAWCPLVIKEFANSGHLDAISVFLSSAAVYFACKSFFPCESTKVSADPQRRSYVNALLGCILLALAIGAKLYPVALAPITVSMCFKRFGGRRTRVIAMVFTIVTVLCLAPMFLDRNPHEALEIELQENPFAPVADSESPLAGQWPVYRSMPSDRRAGLKAFLSSWMMNDFIFLNISENVTPDRLRAENVWKPWFVFLPDGIRQSIAACTSNLLSIEESHVPFLLARTATAIIFLILSCFWAWRSTQADTTAQWLQYVFLTMAWFWLLLPTLNPWYWIWALPWIPFAKNRVWLVMSGLLFTYYLRFHFAAHYPNEEVVPFAPYAGEAFFDYVVVWFEYVPWFVGLLVWQLTHRTKRTEI